MKSVALAHSDVNEADIDNAATLDLAASNFVVLLVGAEGCEHVRDVSFRYPMPAHAEIRIDDDTFGLIFRRPTGLREKENYIIADGVSVLCTGRVPLPKQAELAIADELPTWCLPEAKIAFSIGAPANDNNEAEQEAESAIPIGVDPAAPAFSDEQLALDFAKEHSADLRFVAAWNRWLRYDGKRWRYDETHFALNRAREICRKAGTKCNETSRAKSIASARAAAAVISLGKADPRLAATAEQWDADPWLLNTPNGVIDLRIGKLRPHRHHDFMTKMTSVGPDSNCQTPTWLGFLNQVLPKPELVDFTKRVCGYALTGATHAHALFFFYGTGANGKTTLLNTIINCAGDYHRSAAIETFTNSNIERHPTEIAGLLGARVVTASETEEGRRWAESRIKALTGGDKISARFMRQDFFEFTPQFKLLIAGNHKPGLHSVDEAIRRRFHLLPFDVTIPPEKRDPTLPEKIKRELPGILAWMIEGCLEFQRVGLAPPASVTDATSDYLNDEDSIGAWIDECCAKDPAAFASNANLYASWSAWAKNAGEYGGNQRRFLERLEGRGFQRDRNRDARGIVGLVVRVIPAF